MYGSYLAPSQSPTAVQHSFVENFGWPCYEAVVTCGIIGEPGADGGMMAGAAIKLQSGAPGRTAGRGLSGAGRTVALHQRSRLFRAVRPGERCGAVLDKAGAKTGNAEALRLHLPEDSVTVTIP